MIGTASWNVDKMEASCVGGHANATDLADYLVRKGMPFRTAHGVAAKAVRMGIESNCNIEDLSIQQLKECSELIEDDIFSMITPEACVNVRTVTGGPSEKSVENQIVALTNYCNEFSRK